MHLLRQRKFIWKRKCDVKLLIFVPWLLLVGCASNSGIVPMGQDTFKILKRGSSGLTNSETVKADAMIQASEYCGKQKKSLKVISVLLGSPPYISGNYPKAELQFKCLDPSDPELNPTPENASTEPVRSSGDYYTELRRLKSLLNDGIITQEEFDAKKKKILAK
jgi:hypothetical protein